MYKQRFIKALAASAALHLLLFAGVSVVVEPSPKLTFYPRVTFLGSILSREVVSPIALSNKSETKTGKIPCSFRREPAPVKKLVLLKVRRISFNREFLVNRTSTIRRGVVKPETIFSKSRKQPEYSGKKAAFVRFRAKKRLKGAANIFWNSPDQRGVFYEPPLPEEYLRANGTKGDFNLEFDFLVSPQGRIIAVKKLISSGFSGIDAQAMRYLKKWQFAPSVREQWGKIRLNFELR